MQRIVALTALFLLGPGLALGVAVPTAGATDHSARSVGHQARKHRPPLTAKPSIVPTGHKVKLRGDIGVGPRKIRIQLRGGHKWRTIQTRKTRHNGKFKRRIALAVTASRNVAIRVVAPRAKVRGKMRARVVTTVRKVGVTGPIVAIPSYEDQVLTLVNQQRAKYGCGPLRMQSQLRTAARRHSADMARYNVLSHVSHDGSSLKKRVRTAGYKHWMLIGENVAAGQRSPAGVMNSWMHSSGHRANILLCKYRQIGIGVAYARGGSIFWTQDFGRR